MPEIKNNFLSSKMNKDIDDRLMPNNEYRNAINLQINRSEGSDVGTLQNVLGNNLAVDFYNVVKETLNSGEDFTPTLECIGVLADDSNNDIYVFLTNYSGAIYSPTARNYIYVYNNTQLAVPPYSTNPILLASGAFLNFSTQSPIYGINLIENLLFWTDNRNQPRKINVKNASENTDYYINEEQISVAKLSPLYTPELFKYSDFNTPLLTSGAVGTVSGTGPYTATITPSPVFASSLLTVGMTIYATPGTSSFTRGVVTSITTAGLNVASFVVSSDVIFTTGSVTSLDLKQYETTMYDVVSPYLPNSTTTLPYSNPNPYLINDYPGDPAYLESRYARFSYRYKFEDNEYSIMAPFTQIAYIPKQDGYFLYNAASPAVNDEESAYRSTIVSFMQNKVNNILLQIALPSPANEVKSLCKIVEIEILYKEADSIVVSVVDSIPTSPGTVEDPNFWNSAEEVYVYNYQSKKPFKTLPERDVIRVNDITPVKAMSQEVAGNRVIYGNYQDKYSYPKYLDYNVGASAKLPFGFGENQGVSRIEYPNHSVKENRNYQVGVILCDKFGRQSGVILSDLIVGETVSGSAFGASSLYVPYYGVDDILPSTYPGNSLKILFNNEISPVEPNANTKWPGLYNGDINSVNYNPVGWYSYKIVVKQIEQDYYNVYLPGIMAAYPTDQTLELGKTSHTVLINDNINKIPRDLTEVGPAQKQFRSSVILYPRVDNNTEPYNNNQVDPGNTYAFASTIATASSLFYPDGVFPTVPLPATVPLGFEQFYQINSDPLIARISTVEKLGVISTSDVINLAVYETKPTESRIDIYWETSTAGLISELNTAIQLGTGADNINNLLNWEFQLSEAANPDTIVTIDDGFYFVNIIGADVDPDNVFLESVYTLTNVDVTNKFYIVKTVMPGDADRYEIKTSPGAYFYYGVNAVNAESYIFTIKATIGSTFKTFVRTGLLTNEPPVIAVSETTFTKEIGEINVYDFNGVNGSNIDGGRSTDNLRWTVTNQDETPSALFTITPLGLLQNLNGTAEGTFLLRVNLFDAGNLLNSRNITVTYPIREQFSVDGNQSVYSPEPDGYNQTTGTINVEGSGWQVRLQLDMDLSAAIGFGRLVINNGPAIIIDISLSGYGGSSSFSDFEPLPPGDYEYLLSVSTENGTGFAMWEYRLE
ncbi:MAG: hypothetical protein ACOVK2_05980 [Candidatus Fonsibacter sp.]